MKIQFKGRAIGALALVGGLIGIVVACSNDGPEASKNRQPSITSAKDYSRLDQFGRRSVPVCPDLGNGAPRCLTWLTVPDEGSEAEVVSPNDTQGNATGWGATDLAAAYDIPTSLPTNATVAVIAGNDWANLESDLAVYRSTYGLPACTTANGCFRKLDVNGGTNLPSAVVPGKEAENDLDVEMVSAGCPNCKILVLESEQLVIENFWTAMSTAVRLGANAISISYWLGTEQVPNGPNPDAGQFANYFYQTNAGSAYTIPIFVASGDYGFYTSSSYTQSPQIPADFATVISVGGTVLAKDSSTSRGWTETLWSGTGSACSTIIPKPSFQHDSLCSNRTMNDVAAAAYDVLEYDSYSGGSWAAVQGTSAAAPLVAGIYAQVGLTNAAGAYYAYANPSAFFDITSGSNGSCGNGLCNAGIGYDGPTWNGSPNAYALEGEFITINPRLNSVAQNSIGGVNVYIPGSWASNPSELSYSVSGLPAGVTFTGGETYYNGGSPFASLNLTASSSAPITSSAVRILVNVTSSAYSPPQTGVASAMLSVTACVPKTCEDYCGSGSNGCGGTLDCGNTCVTQYGPNWSCKNNACVLTNPNSCPCGGTKPHCQLCQVQPVGDGGAAPADVERADVNRAEPATFE